MSYPFVAARDYTARGIVEARAIVLHMAEGTGTVSWLTHPTNDNSSHFVVERSGRVVQMVREADADHSLHVDRAYGPAGSGDCGIFSLDRARDLLGAGINDPNAYLFAVEIEGWALDHYSTVIEGLIPAGPNPSQVVAIRALIEDLHARHSSLRGVLGHRDFQDYKACPGCHVFDKVAHGPFLGGSGDIPVEDTMQIYDRTPKQYRIDPGTQLYGPDFAPLVTTSLGQIGITPLGVLSPNGSHYRLIPVVTNGVDQVAFVHDIAADVTLTPVPVPVVSDCSGAVGAALETYRNKILEVPVQ